MRTYAKNWPERLWAIEGSNGAGRPLAQRLLEAGEQVVDVPARLAAAASWLQRPKSPVDSTRVHGVIRLEIARHFDAMSFDAAEFFADEVGSTVAGLSPT